MLDLLAIAAFLVALAVLYLALCVMEWVAFAACSLRSRYDARINRKNEDDNG